MSRDVSGSIGVAGQPVVIAVLILDVDTGLIRGLSVGEDIGSALSQSVERALTKPAGSLPPGYPQRILAAVGIGDLVASPNSAGSLGSNPCPRLTKSCQALTPRTFSTPSSKQ
jgi:hypothetical protein